MLGLLETTEEAIMRVRYTDILIPHMQGWLREHLPMPEPPTEEEIAHELAGLEKLSAALKEISL